MFMKKETSLVPTEIIENKIYLIRGAKVMLDSDLANLYGVSIKRLNEQVKRNLKRFPPDFMFQLKENENKKLQSIRSQFATFKRGQHRKYLPYVFTEHGVTMLASVLNSERAVEISIYVVRAFIKIREMLATHKNLIHEFEKMKQTQKKQGQHIINILNVISQLLNPPPPPPEPPKEPIGFRDRRKD
jgi:phage regulator Rha-like protein